MNVASRIGRKRREQKGFALSTGARKEGVKKIGTRCGRAQSKAANAIKTTR
jgi:hypothetical protein